MSSLPNVRAAHQSHAEPATITTLAAAQTRFTERHDKFRCIGVRIFRNLGYDPDRVDELVQASLVETWRRMTILLRKGSLTDHKIGKCFKYSYLNIHSGRIYRGDRKRPRDVNSAARHHGFTVVTNFDFQFLVFNHAPSVLDIVQARLDVPAWFDSLSPKWQSRARMLGSGMTNKRIAALYGFAETTVGEWRTRLYDYYVEYVSH
jgi:hypothetical protein